MAVGPCLDAQISSPMLLGARLAAFAAGCLGTPSLAKAGSRLGLMGSADEEEFQQLLQHLERLARQRAAKLAGCTMTNNDDADVNAANMNRCSEAFAKAVSDACGASITEIFRDLPSDAQGRADMLLIFQMANKSGPDIGRQLSLSGGNNAKDLDPNAAPQSPLADLPLDYIEKASSLPQVSSSALRAAEARLSQTASEANWSLDIAAVNAVRGAYEQRVMEEVKPSVLISISTRCGSRRPALAKAALRALLEVTNRKTPEGVTSIWASRDAAVACHRGCLSAARGTKLMSRFAEDVMEMASTRIAEEVSAEEAVIALMLALEEELQERSPQPAVFALALKIATTATSKLVREQESEATARTAALCKAVLDQRRLAPSYSQARACLRNLPAACQAAAAAPATTTTATTAGGGGGGGGGATSPTTAMSPGPGLSGFGAGASPKRTGTGIGGAGSPTPTPSQTPALSPSKAAAVTVTSPTKRPASSSPSPSPLQSPLPSPPGASSAGPGQAPVTVTTTAVGKSSSSSLSPSQSPSPSPVKSPNTSNSNRLSTGGKATLTSLKGQAMSPTSSLPVAVVADAAAAGAAEAAATAATATTAAAAAVTAAASSPSPSTASTPSPSVQLLHSIASKSTSKASLSTTASTSTMATTGEISLEEVVALVGKAVSKKEESGQKATKSVKKTQEPTQTSARC